VQSENLIMSPRLKFVAFSRLVVVLTALFGLLSAGPVGAQSLGSVAKEAEAKRKTTKSTTKVYTNDTLKSDPTPSQAAPSASGSTPTAASPSQSGVNPEDKDKAKAKDDEAAKRAKDEAYWRDRVKAEREALARAETFAGALQSQINGLYGEFTACQAPPQCNEISAKRQKSIAELDRVKKEVDQHTKGIADIQEEARRAGVPAGWVR
jgi:hypothetical protein